MIDRERYAQIPAKPELEHVLKNKDVVNSREFKLLIANIVHFTNVKLIDETALYGILNPSELKVLRRNMKGISKKEILEEFKNLEKHVKTYIDEKIIAKCRCL